MSVRSEAAALGHSLVHGAKWRVFRVLHRLGLRSADPVVELYAGRPFLDAYAAHTDLRVERNPHKAVGGAWQRLGKLQFDFLRTEGMQPDHQMLDIGCGTLRGGRHFIRYLRPGNYTGMDISAKAIEYGHHLVAEEGLQGKRPRLLLTRDLRFQEFAGQRFDFILAQSVFTHLPREIIEECFQHIGEIMAPGGRFYFTFNRSVGYRRVWHKNFRYPTSFFESLSARYGYTISDCVDKYPHPNGQRMLVVTHGPRGI